MSDTPAPTLQDMLDGIRRDAIELGETIDRLEDENRKLRLLVMGMATYERMDTDVDPLRALEIREAIKRLADELGVEVMQ